MNSGIDFRSIDNGYLIKAVGSATGGEEKSRSRKFFDENLKEDSSLGFKKLKKWIEEENPFLFLELLEHFKENEYPFEKMHEFIRHLFTKSGAAKMIAHHILGFSLRRQILNKNKIDPLKKLIHSPITVKNGLSYFKQREFQITTKNSLKISLFS